MATKRTSKKRRSLSLEIQSSPGSNQKYVAASYAVLDQLYADNHTFAPMRVMGAGGYGYTSDLMQGFLGGVSGRLAWHQPAFSFSFDSAFGDAALKLTAGVLAERVGDRTTENDR